MRYLLVALLLLAQPAWAVDYHWNASPSEVSSAEWYAQNMATADFTAGDVLNHIATVAPTPYQVAVRHQTASPATGTSTVTLHRFMCSIANDTGTGTANFNLVVYEDDADTTAETIATISFNLATEINELKQTTTFAAITSAAPFFFAVQLSDGGSVALTGATSRSQCQVVWSRS